MISIKQNMSSRQEHPTQTVKKEEHMLKYIHDPTQQKTKSEMI
jgi:hypothetical protein